MLSSIIPYTMLYGIFSAVFIYFRTTSKTLSILIPPSLWIIGDYIREISPFYLPWGFAGYTQVFTPVIQIGDLTGIYGITFCIILINLLVTKIIIDKQDYINPLILSVLVISVITYSHFRQKHVSLKLSASQVSDEIKIAAIQGNFTTYERWDIRLSQFRYTSYVSLSEKNISGADIIIWPETVLNSADSVNLEIIKEVSSKLSPGQLFITGATRSEISGKHFNSVFIASKSGIMGIYDKIILFPYSEKSFSGFSAGRFLNAPEKFEPGRTQKTISTAMGQIGITICFESIYPDFVRKIKNNETDFILNIANDSWFGSTSEPYIHLYSNIARAVELRIPVIRSTNNGISAIIHQTGKMSALTTLDKQEVLKGSFSKNKITSAYAHLGDLILIFSAVIILAGVYQKQKNAI